MTTEEVYGRPCRACTDFKSFMKTVPGPGGQAVGAEKVAGDDQQHHQCPPDRMELGSRSWSLLHSVAAYFPSKPTVQQQEDARNFMHLFSRYSVGEMIFGVILGKDKEFGDQERFVSPPSSSPDSTPALSVLRT